MDTNKVLKDVLNEPNLTKNGCFDTDVFFYLSGRHPELTIREAVEVVKLAREECAGIIFDNPDLIEK